MKSNTAVIILAAGLGTRMKSNKAKVLHEIQSRPMVSYVVETARQVAGNNVIVVVGNQAEKVRQVVSENEDLLFAYQEKQLGTAHAVLCAVPQIPEPCTEVVILCGDVPLIRPETVSRLIDDHLEAQRDISLLAVELENPFGYGRILLDSNDQLSGIVEEADATSKQKRIKMINSGIYCVNKEFLVRALPQVRSNNAQGELYLTDIIEIGYIAKTTMGVMVGADEREILGVNNLKDLQQVDAIMKTRMRIIS
jgi:UDP-N-acetylglucosamine diphosphorylase/glucosamine-1-phosphate N-acetyltransferase